MNTEERLPVPNAVSPFERIRRTNAAGAEYSSSRDSAQVLGYLDYRNLEQAMKKAKTACFNSSQRVEDHFVGVTEMVAESARELKCRRRKQLSDGATVEQDGRSRHLTGRIWRDSGWDSP